MIVAVDFDGTVVGQDHPYDDLDTPLRLLPGAREALRSLKAAGHVLVLCSARSNLALRKDWRLNPLWRTGAVLFDPVRWEMHRALNEARYLQMIDFVEGELPGVFDAIDDGSCGKFAAGVYIDDKALRLGPGGITWPTVAELLGEDEEQDDGTVEE